MVFSCIISESSSFIVFYLLSINQNFSYDTEIILETAPFSLHPENATARTAHICQQIWRLFLMETLQHNSDVPTLLRLRSTTRGNLFIPRTNTKTFGLRGFAAAGPAFWNTLPDNVRDLTLSLPVFKQRLKFCLFNPPS